VYLPALVAEAGHPPAKLVGLPDPSPGLVVAQAIGGAEAGESEARRQQEVDGGDRPADDGRDEAPALARADVEEAPGIHVLRVLPIHLEGQGRRLGAVIHQADVEGELVVGVAVLAVGEDAIVVRRQSDDSGRILGIAPVFDGLHSQ